jgi:hypothetical protein
MLYTTKQCWEKLKKTSINGEIYCALTMNLFNNKKWAKDLKDPSSVKLVNGQ